jgi:hypothetical protein
VIALLAHVTAKRPDLVEWRGDFFDATAAHGPAPIVDVSVPVGIVHRSRA